MQEITFEVKSESGQKQLASLLELHFGILVSQVLMHLGTEFGHGAEGTGVLSGMVGEVPVGEEHSVQTVEVEIRVIVETVV